MPLVVSVDEDKIVLFSGMIFLFYRYLALGPFNGIILES
jgi:hypothetical protein